MKVVVLNECFLSDKNLADLHALGEVALYNDTTDEATAIKRMAGKDIVLSDMYECPLNKNVLSQCANVKFLCINSTGYDLVDLETTQKNNTLVANTPGFSTEAVAEHVFALLLAINRRILSGDQAVRTKPFQINPADKAHYKYLGFNLAGKTIGIVGLGAIGSHVAKIAAGFGMKCIAYNRHKKVVSDVSMVSLDELFQQSDIITLHTPFNEDSKALINATTIEKMKSHCIIINTARGGCVVSADLAAALKAGKIGGAGLDVLDSWTTENPLLHTPNTLITPHSAWFTTEALGKIGDIMTENVKAFVAGKNMNVIS